jgi:aspartyl-tRNA(Asn)/glutamyl-tRNA(Gln) amidotransferase subunit B
MERIMQTRLKIGMEVHIELATHSKMFSRSANTAHPDHYDAAPNTLVDPVVAALPGALPVMNRRAVEMAMMVGLALECTIARFSRWDRKNYFYPDLPKGYQISQYDLPLCREGGLSIPAADGGTRRVRVIRAHLEEDTGKLGHELPGGLPYEGSLVDLNRAGTPLLEIVTHPDMGRAEEAVTFARELRTICRYLGVTEGIMQRGHIRFEPNVNVIIRTGDGADHATPVVEIKNLNSFRAIREAIDFEHARQVDAWRRDGIEQAPGTKSTRGWDDAARVTVLQREKEEAHDYRYFPDPDLVPVVASDEWVSRVAAELPELPMARRARYVQAYGLSQADAFALTEERDVCLFFEACVAAARDHAGMDEAHAAAGTAKLLLNAGARLANARGCLVHELGIAPLQVAGLLDLRSRDMIGSSAADELLGLLAGTDADVEGLARKRGLIQVRDAGRLEAWCAEAIAAQPQAAEDFRRGKQAALGRLVGHVMKSSGGQADATLARQTILAMIGRPQE